MEPRQARTYLAILRMGLGAMWLTPAVGAKLLGLDPEAQPSTKLLARLFAVRDLVIGAALLQAEGEEAERQVDVGIAVDLADLAAIIMAASRKEIGGRTLVLGGAAAASAAALGIVARGDR